MNLKMLKIEKRLSDKDNPGKYRKQTKRGKNEKKSLSEKNPGKHRKQTKCRNIEEYSLFWQIP